MTRDGGCSAQSVGLRVCFTHVVGQGCVVALPASQRLRRLLQNLVVLLGKQSKQAAQRERERKQSQSGSGDDGTEQWLLTR